MTALSITFVSVTYKWILSFIVNFISDIRVGSIVSSTILFFIPSLLLGTIISIVLKQLVDDMDKVGKISGKIYAISTLGGIFGTFFCGFLLIPNFGSVKILIGLSICSLLISCFIKENSKCYYFIIILILINCLILILNNKNNIINNKLFNDGNINSKLEFNTNYGSVAITNEYYNNNVVRVLKVDDGNESATYTDLNKVTDLVIEYTKYYDAMFNANININNILMIGGCGYSYPKYFISNYLDKFIDVIEIDDMVTNIAKKYFYLDKLIDEYDLNDNKRLNIYSTDGRTYLNTNKKKYDAILNDAFSGKIPPKDLTTREAIIKIKKSLNYGGVYLTNIISSLGGNNMFLVSEFNTLKSVFNYVYIIPCNTSNADIVQNIMVIASDVKIDSLANYYLDIDKGIILTDDYAPIEYIINK